MPDISIVSLFVCDSDDPPMHVSSPHLLLLFALICSNLRMNWVTQQHVTPDPMSRGHDLLLLCISDALQRDQMRLSCPS